MLEYKQLVEELGPINLYNTVVAERKNGRQKKILISRHNYNCIVTSLGRHVESNELAEAKETPFIGGAKEMSDKKHEKLSEDIQDLTNGKEVCWKVNVDNVEFRRGQVMAFYGKEDIACTKVNYGIIEAFVNLEQEMAFITTRLSLEYLDDLVCYKIVSRDGAEVVGPEQLACHCPCNIVEMGQEIGEVFSLKATPTCF